MMGKKILEFIVINSKSLLLILGLIVGLLIFWKIVLFSFKSSKKQKDKLITKIVLLNKNVIYFVLILVGLKIGFERTGISGLYLTQMNIFFGFFGILLGSYLFLKTMYSISEHYEKDKLGVGNSFLLRRLSKFLVVILSFILILDLFSIEISPLLAGLGIAGLAIAFALQDTLANLFSGIYLNADQPIRPGDYVEVGSDIKGTILNTTWRSTRILTFDGNTVIIPNKRLGESVITNYNLPKKEMITMVKIDASRDSDPEKVEKVIYETAKKVVQHRKECIKEYEPVVRFYEFGDYGLRFFVLFKTKSRGEKFAVEHELRKELYKAFKKNKISIPFPTHTVHLNK